MEGDSGVWELPAQNFPPDISSSASNLMRNLPYGNGTILPPILQRASVAPPLPPRPINITSAYNNQGSHYNNYNFGGYPNYGGSSFGYGYRPGFNTYGYGYGQNAFYNPNNPESRFIQLAEESSRPAFQAIQSVLQSFSSVAMMFDSTFNALYSSYMSVISVADNFGKLRSTFGQVFSLLAVFRAVYWMYRRLLYFLGISQIDPETEHLWVNALNNGNEVNPERTQKPWSTMLFLSIITAGPYLLFKLMSRLYPHPIRETWNPIQNPGTTAVGVYPFHSSNEHELSFSSNQKLMIAPEKFQPPNCPGWVLACDKNQKTGLVPKNHIGIMMRSEVTGKPYIKHNGQSYEITNYVRPKVQKNLEEEDKKLKDLLQDNGTKMKENVGERE